MRRELLALEPNLVFVENQTMEAEVDATLFPMRAGAWLVSGRRRVAMLLAAIGLYGVIAYSVARRTREIGIRMALGARPASVVGLVMRQGLVVAGVGLAVGCVLAAVVGARSAACSMASASAIPCRGWRASACCSASQRSPTSSPPGAPRASIRRRPSAWNNANNSAADQRLSRV